MSLTCGTASAFEDANMPARIASVFVLLVLSAAGAFFPLLAVNYRFFRIPDTVIYVTRYFGSGVIVATAFIHLLGESQDSLSHPCVGDFFSDYSWAAAFSLMGVVTMFTIEAFTHRRMDHQNLQFLSHDEECASDIDKNDCREVTTVLAVESRDECGVSGSSLSDLDVIKPPQDTFLKALVSIYLLEFGIVFHSVFVGLSLAVAGREFKTLFVAICFHQFFEGMGLGARFATANWPAHMKKTPWLLSAAYAITTPLGIAVGLGVRHLYLDDSPTSLIVVGVFDGFCSGLLIYNGLVELMARDFINDPQMKKTSHGRFALAYMVFLLGASMMALLGKWA